MCHEPIKDWVEAVAITQDGQKFYARERLSDHEGSFYKASNAAEDRARQVAMNEGSFILDRVQMVTENSDQHE